MPLTLNTLLRDAGLDPRHVRLLRHETKRHCRTPYALWRDDPLRFDDYQRVQSRARGSYFTANYWASFVVAPGGKTLFVGISEIGRKVAVPDKWIDPISGREGASLLDYDLYELMHTDALGEYVGKLVIDWGGGTRTWVQRADLQDKTITELHERFVEPSFPGYSAFISPLSAIESMPTDWLGALSAAKGVYLLTCPRTREQYVGAAYGERGFVERWACYARDTHGGNVALKSREPSDYQVTILQVAGSADDVKAIIDMEALWKHKLQSREMGLNRN